MKLDGWNRLAVALSIVWAGFVVYGGIKSIAWLRRHEQLEFVGDDFWWWYAAAWVIGCVWIWLVLRTVAWIIRGFRADTKN